MSEVLHRDVIPSGGHVTRAPRWVRPATAENYWHVVRSASVDSARLTVRTWCGQLRYPEWSILTDDDPNTMICGTCVGRADGYKRRAGRVFRPRDNWDVPRRCPGRDDGNGCFACGSPIRYRYSGGGMNECAHAPTGELAANWHPCPQHGWRHITATGTVGLHCSYWRCEYREKAT